MNAETTDSAEHLSTESTKAAGRRRMVIVAIILRLPYMEWACLAPTGGKTFEQ